MTDRLGPDARSKLFNMIVKVAENSGSMLDIYFDTSADLNMVANWIEANIRADELDKTSARDVMLALRHVADKVDELT